MNYANGHPIALGDIVRVPVPGGTARARVVMLGDTYAHSDIDAQFVSWVKNDRVLEVMSVVTEWIGANPFAHQDPSHASVGNYMFSPADEYLERDA